MAFKNVLSVMPVPGGYAVAIDRKATGQIFKLKETAQAEVDKIRAERKSKRDAENK